MRKSKIKIKPNIPRPFSWRLILGQSFTFYTPRTIQDCYARIVSQRGVWDENSDLQGSADPTHRNRATFKFEAITSDDGSVLPLTYVCITGTLVQDDTHTCVKGNARISWVFRLFALIFLVVWPLVWILGGINSSMPLYGLIGLAGILAGALLLRGADHQAKRLYQRLHELLV